LGVVSRNYLLKRFEEAQLSPLSEQLRDVISGDVTVAFTDEPLRVVVYRMVESGFTRLPVVDRDDETRLLGMVSLDDLLRARGRNLEEERTRERLIRLRMPLGRGSNSENITVPDDPNLRA
jgi:CBS-domain-containing membrane protein